MSDESAWRDLETIARRIAAALKDMPEERQDAVARAIITYSKEDEALHLTNEQVAEIERRMANPNRKFISLQELDKRLRRLGV